MRNGFIDVVECFYSLFDGLSQPMADNEDFSSYHKKDLMNWMIQYAEMFHFDVTAKPFTLVLDNQEDFDIALAKIMKIQSSKDPEEFIVENGPRFVLCAPFFDNIHQSLTKRNHSELLPILKKIKGSFSFKINNINDDAVLCTGEGLNGQFTFSIPELNIRLPRTLEDLPDFGYDLSVLFEISHDLDFIMNQIKITALKTKTGS